MEFSNTAFGAQPPIEAYGDGGFRLDKKRVTGSMILLPDTGMFPWAVDRPDQIDLGSFDLLVEARETFDLVLVGTGEKTAFLSADVRAALREVPLHIEVMDTGAACRTYNVLLGEGRKVSAALIAV